MPGARAILCTVHIGLREQAFKDCARSTTDGNQGIPSQETRFAIIPTASLSLRLRGAMAIQHAASFDGIEEQPMQSSVELAAS